MKKERIKIVKEYLNRIDEIENSNEYNSFPSDAVDLTKEIIAILSEDIKNIEHGIEYHNHSIERNLRVLKQKIRLFLVEYEPAVSDEELYEFFWTSFLSWLESDEVFVNFFKDEYFDYDYDFGESIPYMKLDYEFLYKTNYGLVTTRDEIYRDNSISGIKKFIELLYEDIIKNDKDTRYNFTILVNKRLEKFKVPFRLQRGKLINNGHKSTFYVDEIINYRMFERKIQYSEEMILSSETLDKKTALDYIVDALQYFVSIQEGIRLKERYTSTANLVSSGDNKINAVIKKELDELMKIANEYFDIRHNEYLNKSKEIRENLKNPVFIEYLYNRIFSLLYLLRLNYKVESKSNEKM